MTENLRRVVVRLPGNELEEHVDLSEHDELIVGRDPSWDRLGARPANGEVRKTLAVSAPSVSANHVLLKREGERVVAADLGSRNGTWVEVPRNREVSVSVGGEPLTLRLAPSLGDDAESAMPSLAPWSTCEEYVSSMCAAVQAWLDAKGLPARVAVVPRAGSAADAAGRMPLAGSSDLVVESTSTVGVGWLQALARIERFVGHQTMLFETEEAMRAEGLVVASPAMRSAVARVVQAAQSGARVLLLTGPSGAGKEGLARCFHRHARASGPFVARNCALFSRELVRAELFGAEKGSFTGSVRRTAGAVESANEGTLFLDEIGELPKEVQPMLLRFLDYGEYERVGSDGGPNVANVQIVAATNRDLRTAALQNEFRTDLWFRLSVYVVDVPPLKERPEDVTAFLRSFQVPGAGKSLFDVLTPDAMEALSRHEWHGNFRELTNFAQRTSAIAARGPVSREAALRSLREGALHAPAEPAPIEPTAARDTGAFSAAMERAIAAFADDHDGAAPRTWDQVKDLIESYVKPLLFSELSGSTRWERFQDVDLRAAAEALHADRGTALKQLRRYFDRFPRRDGD